MNRNLLGIGGLALSDDEYAQVIAELGRSPAYLPPAPGGMSTDFGWSSSQFELQRQSLGPNATRAALLKYRDSWAAARGILNSNPRIAVQSEGSVRGALDLIDVVRILSHFSLGVSSVFINRSSPEADLRWQWPLRIAGVAEDFETLGLATLKDEWPASALALPAALTRDSARAEILLVAADIRGALVKLLSLNYKVRAGLVVLVGPPSVSWLALQPLVDALLAETQAGGIAIVTGKSPSDIGTFLNDWLRDLSHNLPLDEALAKNSLPEQSLLILDPRLRDAAGLPASAERMGRRLQQLPNEVTLKLASSTLARIALAWSPAQPATLLGNELISRVTTGSLPFNYESEGGSAIAEMESAERDAEREIARGEPARYLQGSLFSSIGEVVTPEKRGLLVGVRYALDVLIGEKGLASLTADQRFPDELLLWPDGAPLTLQVIFVEPQLGEPLEGVLKLPKSGASSTCRFVFTPNVAAPFKGRITLYYRGRVLQTALLRAIVQPDLPALMAAEAKGEGISLRVEAEIRRSLRTLHERRRFDACLICNHTATRQSAITAAATDGAYIASLNKLDVPIARINELLSEVANDARRYSKGLATKGNAKLLCDLAREGNALYRTIVIDNIQRSTSAKQVQEAEYLQIVTMEADSIVPLEFIYEYPLPADGSAVCPNALEALRTGSCPASCRPTKSPALHVCPMGFWGLSKVLERHLHVPDLEKAAKVIPSSVSEPISGRDELSLKGASLLAVSTEVDQKKNVQLDRAVRAIRRGTVATVKTWPSWQQEIAEKKPILLVVLPHADGSGAHISLEIGGNTLQSAFIDRSYVHPDAAPPPLAMLLGCDTTNTADTSAYLRHMEVFRQADAALVVGTIGTVLGVDAADIAERLLKHLTDSVRRKPGRIGEVLRDVKRAAVADSMMIGLSLVAFGDADWFVTS